MQIHVLGTSTDLNRLAKEWFKDKYVIGINSSYQRAEQLGVELTEWLCHDHFMSFFNWVLSNKAPVTRKWILYDYVTDDRLQKFVKPVKDEWKDHRVQFYQVRKPPYGTLQPNVVQALKNEELPVLDDNFFTIFTAISLAVGLGATDIRLRGVSLKGNYFNEHIDCDRDKYNQAIKQTFQKTIVPWFKSTGRTLHNETEDCDERISTL